MNVHQAIHMDFCNTITSTKISGEPHKCSVYSVFRWLGHKGCKLSVEARQRHRARYEGLLELKKPASYFVTLEDLGFE